MNRNITKFLQGYRKVTYSDVCIQTVNSEKCGEFCIAFVKSVSILVSLTKKGQQGSGIRKINRKRKCRKKRSKVRLT